MAGVRVTVGRLELIASGVLNFDAGSTVSFAVGEGTDAIKVDLEFRDSGGGKADIDWSVPDPATLRGVVRNFSLTTGATLTPTVIGNLGERALWLAFTVFAVSTARQLTYTFYVGDAAA